MQVDWLSGFVEAPPEFTLGYDAGRYLKLGPDGELEGEWSAKRQVCDDSGSWRRSFVVGTPSANRLYLSGNPVKLLQGHNAFGSCDALGLFFEAGLFVRHHAGLFPSPATWQGRGMRGPRFTRVDLTRSYRFESEALAHAWVRSVAGAARDRRGAARLRGDSTASFGVGSRRWGFVVYCKHDEMLAEASRNGRGVLGEVLDWSVGVVRFELRLFSNELDKLPGLGERLRGPGARAAALETWQTYFDRITLNGNATMGKHDLIEETLSAHLRVKLAAWRGGEDLRRILSKRTFYRVRRELLEAVGVDIASPPPAAADADPQVRTGLDPAGWDPEPLRAHYVEPREELARQYPLA